jgi:predicted AlkP superfamily phosphohydrolase/phosphomutase
MSFALPGLDGFSALRVNLMGREPDGIVHAGEDYDGYLVALQSEIESWTVGHTRRRAAARIHRSALGADALRLGVAPDLMLWWDKARAIEEIHSPALGTVHGVSADERTGEHVMRSLVLLRHPDTGAASRALSGIGITDLASILLNLTDQRRPAPQA